MVEGNANPAEFTTVSMKVRNATVGEEMGKGVLRAVARYKKGVGQQGFSYSVSGPIDVDSLDTTLKEFTFDFRGSPIPVDITDLYLQAVFKGRIGPRDNATALGFKDISEPTPIGTFNNMDMICIYGRWYVAGSPEAYSALPETGKWWDYYAHDLKNEYIKISSISNPVDASPGNYTFSFSLIPPGSYYRVFVLSDYEFMYSSYGTMAGRDPQDKFIHDRIIRKATGRGFGVRNQEESVADLTVCSEFGLGAPCTIQRTPTYYPFREVEMWGPGGFIIDGVTYPNATEPGYIPCSWKDLTE